MSVADQREDCGGDCGQCQRCVEYLQSLERAYWDSKELDQEGDTS